MNKRGLINWAIWIGVVSGIYCAIYAVTIGAYTDNILPGWHIIYVTFTALPIYFTAGAKREEFWQYIGSYLVGVLWAMLYLVCMDRLNAAGWPWWANVGLVVAVICVVECAIHFCLPAQAPLQQGARPFRGHFQRLLVLQLHHCRAGHGRGERRGRIL